jgi:phosphatidylcholine synthase
MASEDSASEEDPDAASALVRSRAFAVHVFTACGAALALMALIFAVRHAWAPVFLLLGLASIVDGVDGTLARRLRVAEVLPNWSGDGLDFVVDFVTYVFVPAFVIFESGLLPAAAAIPVGLGIVVSGALYFADRRMKTPDNFFRGFPVLWNAVAFYLLLLKPGPWPAAVSIALLIVLTFVPFKFVHPVRVERLRRLSLGLLIVWSLLALVAVILDLDPGPWIKAGLTAIGIYFFVVGLLPTGLGRTKETR